MLHYREVSSLIWKMEIKWHFCCKVFVKIEWLVSCKVLTMTCSTTFGCSWWQSRERGYTNRSGHASCHNSSCSSRHSDCESWISKVVFWNLKTVQVIWVGLSSVTSSPSVKIPWRVLQVAVLDWNQNEIVFYIFLLLTWALICYFEKTLFTTQ